MNDKKTNEKCYPCRGLGYQIESSVEADGSLNRAKFTCACCGGTGKNEHK